MKTYIEERAVEVAKFMIHTNATVRETAKKFGISKSDAKVYADDILKIVRENWEKKAIEYRLTRGQIEKMRPAFTVCY